MKAEFTKYGPKHDYRTAHVVIEYGGRTLLGEIREMFRDPITGAIKCKVRHFNGEMWSIQPCLRALEILERTYEGA